MICPKCGFTQPDGPECMRCGVVVSRYKGPVLAAGAGAAPLPPPPPPAFSPGGHPPAVPPPPPVFSVGQPSGPPPPPPHLTTSAGERLSRDPDQESLGGTVYQGPLPAPGAAGGTVYGGPIPARRGTGTRAGAELSAGKILSETFSVYVANIIPFVILTIFALSPAFVFSAWASSRGAEDSLALMAEPISSILTFLLAPIATAAIIYGVFQQMRGGNASLGDCLKVGLAALLPVLGLAVVQGCAVGFAAMFCLIPGLLLAMRWAVAVPAAVEERVSLGDALSRSTYLTEGYRWQIFAVLATLYLFNVALVVGLIVAFGENAATSGGFLLASSVLDILTTGVAATAYSVMYYRLRSIKESIDVDQIASVFA